MKKHTRRKFFKTSILGVGLGAMGMGAAALGIQAEAKENAQFLQNDPEFREIYQRFLGEVGEQNKLDSKTTLLVRLGSIIATGGKEIFKELAKNLDSIALKELLYQSVPYVGFSKAYEFFALSDEILKAKGVSLPLSKQGTTSAKTRYDEGLKIQMRFFGDAITQGDKAAPDDIKHIRRFLSANCFGDYYTRGGIDLKTRELLTFVFIASLGGCEPQLRAHTLGNLKIKNDRSILISAITQICPFIGYPKTLNALNVVDELTKKG